MGNRMEPAVGVSPLHVGVTLATNRPTWKSTMVATWRAAGCVPAYRDGQVDYGMGRRDTERTGAGFLSFFIPGKDLWEVLFFLLCVLWSLRFRGGEFAGLPMDFNCVDQVCWFSLFLLMCGTLEMANDFSSHLHFATWWLSSFKHFLPQIPPKAWLVWLACGIYFEKQFFPIPFANIRNMSHCEQCWRHGLRLGLKASKNCQETHPQLSFFRIFPWRMLPSFRKQWRNMRNSGHDTWFGHVIEAGLRISRRVEICGWRGWHVYLYISKT